MKTALITAFLTLTLSIFASHTKVASGSTDIEVKQISEHTIDETAPVVAQTDESDRGIRSVSVLPLRFEAFSLFVLGSTFLLVATTINFILSRRSKLKSGESTR
jgi:hypothetical protein